MTMSGQQQERQIMYYAHRLRVQNAKSVVNSQAPQRKAKFCDPINKEMQLLELLSSMSKRNGNLRTFTKSPEVTHWHSNSSNTSNIINSKTKKTTSLSNAREKNGHKVNKQSKRQRSHSISQQQCCQSCCSSDLNHSTEGQSSAMKKSKDIFAVPENVITRYAQFSIQRDIISLRKLLRPKIYLDLEVKGYRPLGRIIIQLFTEACPNVVLEFVRTCLANRHEFFTLTRLFTPLWLEGELAIENSHALATANMEHDTCALDHGSGSGILSFPSRYLRGSKRRFLNFSISFQPLSVLNGKRIAFGKIRYGYRILDVIQELNTKNGKPQKEIVVTSCGMLH